MKNLAIFASGNGSNFQAIVNACKRGEIDAHVSVLICDKDDACVIKRAEREGIDTFIVLPKNFNSKSEFEKEIIRCLSSYNIDLICLAGYMRIVGDDLLNHYGGKIINTHPSILPSFKGKDAIEQAMEYGVKVYGITIHYVNSDLDGGSIIAQKTLGYEGNDIEYLKKRLLKLEHKLYVKTIDKLLKNG